MRKVLHTLVLVLALGAFSLALLLFFNRAAAPPARSLPTDAAQPPDAASVLSTVTASALESHLRALCATPSRFSGSAGGQAAAAYIANRLRGFGYEVFEQPVRVVVPVQREASMLDEQGQAVAGVELHPLVPNWFRTCTTPPEGLQGRILRGREGLAREFRGREVKDNFVLLPLGVSWETAANMGARAVLYVEEPGRSVGSDWQHHVDASFDMPRFLVRGAVAQLDNRTVTLKARVDLAECWVTNIVAVLPVAGTKEAVAVQASYDAYSFVPGLAPGAQQACSPAVLLCAAEQLAADAKDLKRSVILVATAGRAQGLFGIREFLRTVGARDLRAQAAAEAARLCGAAAAERTQVSAALAVAGDPAYWRLTEEAGETAYWASRDASCRDTFETLIDDVLNACLRDSVEGLTRSRLDWMRAGMPVRGPDGAAVAVLEAYEQTRQWQQRVQAVMATPQWRRKAAYADFIAEQQLVPRTLAAGQRRLESLDRKLAAAQADLRLGEALAPFRDLFFVGLDLSARSGQIGIVCGLWDALSKAMPADAELAVQLDGACAQLDAVAPVPRYARTEQGAERVVNLVRKGDANSLGYVSYKWAAPFAFASSAMLKGGYTAFTLATLNDDRRTVGTPGDTLDALLTSPAGAAVDRRAPLDDLVLQAQIVVTALNRLSRGYGRIIPIYPVSDLYTFRGRVVSQIGNSITPNHAMTDALVRFRLYVDRNERTFYPPGMSASLCVATDHEGRFELPALWVLRAQKHMTLDAAVIRPSDGAVTWALSTPQSGPNGPYAVQQMNMIQLSKLSATPVLFRAAPVQIVPMTDPSTLEPYAGFDFMEKGSLAAPSEFKTEHDGNMAVCFVPPETRLYFTFKKGKLANPELMETRAFALNADGPPAALALGGARSIQGAGYLAGDAPRIPNIELDAALSMAQVNSRRVALQDENGMADEMLLTYSQAAVDLAAESQAFARARAWVDAKRRAIESLAYSTHVHPVIRQNASGAIVGILFYLLLALPFAFFMEKLIVGHPDLRGQLAGQGLIFILFFLALRWLHPAYALVRSSYMILLGFVIFALAVMVSAFIGGRFKANIAELNQRLREQAMAADVSRAGAASTAFLLGLGHMRKRPVRTGLTVGILILTVFVMLCFTSVRSDIREVEFPLGKAPYTGLLARHRSPQDIASALTPLRELYGEKHLVVPRDWGGNFTPSANPRRAELTLLRSVDAHGYEAVAHAVLGLTPDEVRVTPIAEAFVVLDRWFETDTEPSCFLPRLLADQLRIGAADVRNGAAHVTIRGGDYRVLGIFDGDRLDAMLDLDGESLLPADILAMQTEGRQGASDSQVASDIPENVPRLPADGVIITPIHAMPTRDRTASIAVALQGLDYAGARELITAHLQRTGQPAYFGLDGVAFYGGRLRTRSVEGLLDLIIPIVIAALTVLNTIRGSVYERRGELFVFNAVGLSPTHIRALFLAEASVYAVVGAVGGYLLAQGIGSLLGAAGITAGLSMNYASLASVAVSVVIMAVVFAASYFPARMAARLAAPARLMARERLSSDGDVIEIDLPFTFSRRDRLAVVPYFLDWFEDFGEGSSGEFFCTPPRAGLVADGPDGAAPCVETTTWLKPYDLGVSQRVFLVVRHMPATGDNVGMVVMTRVSGDRESWERCCHAFIGLLRKRFLTWRAIPDASRDRLMERGRSLLAEQYGNDDEQRG